MLGVYTTDWAENNLLCKARAVIESRREDSALYTGNDDKIIADLLTQWEFEVNGRVVSRHIVGGLLGHWAVWAKRAVELLADIKVAREKLLLEKSGRRARLPSPIPTRYCLTRRTSIAAASQAFTKFCVVRI